MQAFRPIDSVGSASGAHDLSSRKAAGICEIHAGTGGSRIFFEAAMAANKARIPLAKMAVEETGMGDGRQGD